MKVSAKSRPKTKKVRANGQLSGLSGELFVAAELLKRGLLTSITFGNAKGVDLLAYHPNTNKSFAVQVKTVRKRTFFLLSHAKVRADHVYVFVLLNGLDEQVQYFVVPGRHLHKSPEKFSKWFVAKTMPGIYPGLLQKLGYENAWHVFGPEAT